MMHRCDDDDDDDDVQEEEGGRYHYGSPGGSNDAKRNEIKPLTCLTRIRSPPPREHVELYCDWKLPTRILRRNEKKPTVTKTTILLYYHREIDSILLPQSLLRAPTVSLQPPRISTATSAKLQEAIAERSISPSGVAAPLRIAPQGDQIRTDPAEEALLVMLFGRVVGNRISVDYKGD